MYKSHTACPTLLHALLCFQQLEHRTKPIANSLSFQRNTKDEKENFWQLRIKLFTAEHIPIFFPLSGTYCCHNLQTLSFPSKDNCNSLLCSAVVMKRKWIEKRHFHNKFYKRNNITTRMINTTTTDILKEGQCSHQKLIIKKLIRKPHWLQTQSLYVTVTHTEHDNVLISHSSAKLESSG